MRANPDVLDGRSIVCDMRSRHPQSSGFYHVFGYHRARGKVFAARQARHFQGWRTPKDIFFLGPNALTRPRESTSNFSPNR